MGRDGIEENTLDQPPDVAGVVRPFTAQVQASTSELSTRSGVRTQLGIFSGAKGPPTLQPIAVSHTVEKELPKENVEDLPILGKGVTKGANKMADDATDATKTNDKKIAFHDLGIDGIDVLRDVSGIAGITPPDPVGNETGGIYDIAAMGGLLTLPSSFI
jgi:hypothetical protein